ncbi:hypothetical protein V2J09_016695 [Rumex salicifolius]
MSEPNSHAPEDLLCSTSDADTVSVVVEHGAQSLDRANSSNVSRLPDQALDCTIDGASGHSEALGRGISTLMTSVIRDFDSKAVDTSRSQDHLACALNRLTRELDQLLEDAPVPFIMQHAAKISGVRKRVSSLNLVLRSVQQRLDNID